MTAHAIVFDIGGTNTRVALADEGGFGDVHKYRTPQDPGAAVQELCRVANDIRGEEAIEEYVGCVAGTITEDGSIRDARNLPAWEGCKFAEMLSQESGIPARVQNDAALVGLGEASVGAGLGAHAMAYVTVSTGVGGALIENGAIKTYGGVGRIAVRGSDLESLVSGTAVKKKFGIEPKDLESLQEREQLADLLAEGLRALITKWSPDTIVLGGSMIVGMNPIPIARVADSLGSAVQVRKATLGDLGGLHGAVAMLKKGT